MDQTVVGLAVAFGAVLVAPLLSAQFGLLAQLVVGVVGVAAGLALVARARRGTR